MVTIKSSDNITKLQLILLIITVTGLNNHVIVISPLIQSAGRDAWLTVLVTLFLVIIWSLLLLFIHRQMNGEHVIKWMRERGGGWIANTLIFFIVCYLTVISTITLKEMLNWVNVTFLPETPVFFLAVIFGLLCWSLAITSLRTINIMNFFLLVFIVLFGIFVAIANIQYKNFSLLFPFLEHGYHPVLKSVIYQASGMLELILFIFLQHKTETPYRFRHFVYTAIVLSGLTLGPLVGAIIEFGPVEAAKQRFPPYEEWGLVSLGNFIEHVDFLSVYQWLSGAFIRLSLFIFIIREISPGGKKNLLQFLIMSLIVILVLIPITDFTYTHILYSFLIPGIVVFCLSLSILLFILVPLFKKRGRSSNVV